MPALATTSSFLLTALCILLCGTHICTSEPSNDLSQLPVSNLRNSQLPFSSADSSQSTSDDSLSSLSDLLLVKQSILDALSKPPSAALDKDFDAEDQPDKSRLTKRVFCNGFTGCGGRFRGRRRQQQPVAEIGKRLLPNFRKRPFCNSYGCYNSGKKRFSSGAGLNEAANVSPLADALLQERIKKLFCNGYGGCQNLGKRLVVLDTAVAKTVSDEVKPSFPVPARSLLSKLGGLRRVFTPELDDDIDSFINSMRR
ncbi:hypothetical protein BsWGS_05030 [Bradybaena similaris]